MADTSRGKRANRKRRKALSTSPVPPVRMKRLTLDLAEPLHRAIKKNAAALLSEHYHFTD